MTEFLILAAAMIAAALAFVVVPLLRARGESSGIDFARRLRALDEALAAGVIDDREYAAKRAAITEKSDAAAAPTRNPRSTLWTTLAVALLLPATTLLLYRLVGTPQALDATNLAAAAPHEQAADMEQAIVGLAAKLKEHPDDVQGWTLLARAYQATNRLEESRDAFKAAHEHAPDDDDLTVEYAQALALAADDHRIVGEPRALLDAVVKKNPSNQRALWLLGISDYQAQKYDSAIATWKSLLPMLAPDSEVARSVRNEIADAEARRDGREPPADTLAEDGKDGASQGAAGMQGAGDDAAPASTGAARLTIEVALDPKLKDKLDADATLFVFARASSGPPMPLSIQKLKASQLPLSVTLDDSMGVMPTMKLSMAKEVIVGARVSKSGNAMPQSGDLQALSAPLDPHRSEPVALTIDQVVP